MSLLQKDSAQKSVQFDLPDTHPSLNTWTRWNRYIKNTTAKRWYQNIYVMWLSLRKPKFAGKVKIHVVYTMKVNRCRDYDNYTPKFICDGLKQTFITDDNIRIVKAPSWDFVVDKTCRAPFTRVIITEECDETAAV